MIMHNALHLYTYVALCNWEFVIRVVTTWIPTTFCLAASVLAAASRVSPSPPTTAVGSAELLKSSPLRVSY